MTLVAKCAETDDWLAWAVYWDGASYWEVTLRDDGVLVAKGAVVETLADHPKRMPAIPKPDLMRFLDFRMDCQEFLRADHLAMITEAVL